MSLRKTLFLLLLPLLAGCVGIKAPAEFTYTEIKTDFFTIASWQKIKNPQKDSAFQPAAVKIYIEGDGAAFDRFGRPTQNPTPRGHFMRHAAFSDSSDNVVYLARPCQFVKDTACRQQDWTTGRFSEKILISMAQAIRQIAQGKEVFLIGYSGGGFIAAFLAAQPVDSGPFQTRTRLKKLITIAGNLDHERWTDFHKVLPLNESLSLHPYQKQLQTLPQRHFVGGKDVVVPAFLTSDFLGKENIILFPNATHSDGYEDALRQIHLEK
jgi:hypothetical protein